MYLDALKRKLLIALFSGAAVMGCGSSNQQASNPPPPNAVQANDVTHIPEQTQRSVMDFPTGDRNSSVLEVEQIAPRDVRANQEYSYRVSVTNRTDAPLQNVVLHASQPQGLRLSERGQGNVTPRPDANGWLNYNIGTLGPRETRTLTFSGMPTGEGAIRQTYDVAYEQRMTTSINVVAPVLTIDKQAPRDVDVCQPIIWKYTVKNTGSGIARNVVLHDALPRGLTTADGQPVVEANLGDIPAGEARTASAQLKASQSGDYASAASVRSDASEARSDSIGTHARQPRLDLSVKGPEKEYLGKQVAYQVTVRNNGDAPADKTAVRFTISGEARIVDAAENGAAPNALADPTTGTNFGTIDAGQSKTMTITVEPAQAGRLKFDAVASAPCAEQTRQSAQTELVPVAALLLEAVDVQDPVKVGENVVYKIKVTNQGNGPDSNIKVTATLPDGEQFIKAGGATEATKDGQRITFAPVATLAPKQSVNWEVTAKAVHAGDVQFKVNATSDAVKAPAEKAEPTKLY